jgi:hypothetical protein
MMKRRKAMTIVATLTADLECGEGEVKLRTVFDGLDGLIRADVLKDWISHLEVLYNNALRDWEIENDQQRLSKRVAKREDRK